MVYVRAVTFELSVRAADSTIGGIGLQNVWIWCRDGVKKRLVNAKVLGQDVLWSMSDPIIDVKRGADRFISLLPQNLKFSITLLHQSCLGVNVSIGGCGILQSDFTIVKC